MKRGVSRLRSSGTKGWGKITACSLRVESLLLKESFSSLVVPKQHGNRDGRGHVKEMRLMRRRKKGLDTLDPAVT